MWVGCQQHKQVVYDFWRTNVKKVNQMRMWRGEGCKLLQRTEASLNGNQDRQ